MSMTRKGDRASGYVLWWEAREILASPNDRGRVLTEHPSLECRVVPPQLLG